MSKSFSPLYHQGTIWVCELLDGTILREWDDTGKETLFKDIPKSNLLRFHLVNQNSDYYFHCQSGVFTIDGRQYVFPLAGLNLKYGEGLIHFKSAYQELIRNKVHPYQGFGITGYEMGWKVTYGNMKSQVIFSLPGKVFSASVTFLKIPKIVEWKLRL